MMGIKGFALPYSVGAPQADRLVDNEIPDVGIGGAPDYGINDGTSGQPRPAQQNLRVL
jgi:hypothetical protein